MVCLFVLLMVFPIQIYIQIYVSSILLKYSNLLKYVIKYVNNLIKV